MEQNVDEDSRQILESFVSLVIRLDIAINSGDLHGAYQILDEGSTGVKDLASQLENEKYSDLMSELMVANIATRLKLKSGYGTMDDITELVDYATFTFSKVLNDEAGPLPLIQLTREVEQQVSKRARTILERLLHLAIRLGKAIDSGDLLEVEKILNEKLMLERSLLQELTDKRLIQTVFKIMSENLVVQQQLASTGNVDLARAIFPGAETALKQFLGED